MPSASWTTGYRMHKKFAFGQIGFFSDDSSIFFYTLKFLQLLASTETYQANRLSYFYYQTEVFFCYQIKGFKLEYRTEELVKLSGYQISNDALSLMDFRIPDAQKNFHSAISLLFRWVIFPNSQQRGVFFDLRRRPGSCIFFVCVWGGQVYPGIDSFLLLIQ